MHVTLLGGGGSGGYGNYRGGMGDRVMRSRYVDDRHACGLSHTGTSKDLLIVVAFYIHVIERLNRHLL